MRHWRWVAGAAALVLGATAIAAAPAPVGPITTEAGAKAFEANLHPQTGDVPIAAAKATLHLGKDYYFLPADDAKRVLTQVWGNPAENVTNVLGMVLPAGKTAFDNVWGAVVTYEDTGYVADKDAATQDYDAVLESMREGETDENNERLKNHYPTVHLVGWAQQPTYDKANHSLIWARDLAFSGQKVDSLNYDVRMLGRKGVLSLNMVSDMEHLGEVQSAAATFGKTAQFEKGLTYADFDSSIDKTAEYGLAGLVAAGVGVVAVKKLGFLALILAFGKKFIILIGVALAAIGRFTGKLFGKKQDPDAMA